MADTPAASDVAPTGNKPRLVLIHGAGSDRSVWRALAPPLSRQGWDVATPELPGHGATAGPALTSIDDMAEWLLRDAGAAPGGLVLIGHSMGALIALAAAAATADRPDRVRGLVLLGAAETMPVNPALMEAARAGEGGAVDMIVKWAFARPAEGQDTSRHAAMTEELRRTMRRANHRTLAADFAACDGFRDAAGRAARIYCPALVLSGALDKMVPPDAGAALAAHLPDGRHMTLPGCGHMMMLERPMDAAVAILSLLAGLPHYGPV